MKRNRTIEPTWLRALASVVILGAVAHAGLPYLPLTGPPPLRMLAVKNPDTADIIRLANSQLPAATNTLADLEAQAQAQAAADWAKLTNTVPAGTTNATSSGTVFSDHPLSDPRTAAIFAMPTPDLLSITPQMLAAYFHPVAFGTNVNAFVGPYPVGFTPPLPPADNSSHAEYIVK